LSDFSEENSSENLLYLNGSYQFYTFSNILFQSDIGIKIPTNSSSKIDYRLSLNSTYIKDSFIGIAILNYTLIGDQDNFPSNIFSYSLGLGYYILDNFYIFFNFSQFQSIKDIINNKETYSLLGNYNLDENWFFSLTLNKNSYQEKNIILNIGYYW